jgi:hypothetical protein
MMRVLCELSFSGMGLRIARIGLATGPHMLSTMRMKVHSISDWSLDYGFAHRYT